MDSWLRPILSRKQTSVSSPVVEHSQSFIADDCLDDEYLPRIRSSSRISSYTSFKASPSHSSSDVFPNYRQPERVWIKPSADQCAESLMVVMMNKSSMEPVPIEYNSTIMHILEAYNDLLNQIRDKDHAIDVLQQTHTKDVNDYEAMSQAWYQKENDYKAEVKRLEVLLSRTENGMETMLAARSKSVIHGSKRVSDTIRHGIGTIRARHSANSRHRTGTDSSKEAFPPYDAMRRDSELSEKTAALTLEYKTRLPSSSRAVLQRETVSTTMNEWNQPEQPTQYLTKNALDLLTDHHESRKPKFELVSNKSDSSSNSSSTSSGDDHLRIDERKIPIFGSEDKPLPNIPSRLMETGKQTTLDTFLKRKSSDDPSSQPSSARSSTSQLPFSFNPGDDDNILSSDFERDRVKRRTIDEHLSHINTNPPSSRPNTPSNSFAQSNPTSTNPYQTTKPRTGKKSQLQDPLPVQRGDSSSSVVTALRDNSARNSVISITESQYSNNTRHSIEQRSGSSEAVTAAAKAFAEAGRRKGSRDSGGSSVEAKRDGNLR